MIASAGVVIRRAEERDAEAILAMARELATAVEDPPPQIDCARLSEYALGEDRWGDCFIAEREGSPLGYALACRTFEAHTGQRRLWLADLYVRAEARRSGVGHALIGALARHALSLGCSDLYWELWRKNMIGGRFYRELGGEWVDDLAIVRVGAERLAELARQRPARP